MGKALSDEAVARYRRDGFHFPVPALTPAEAARLSGAGWKPRKRRTAAR